MWLEITFLFRSSSRDTFHPSVQQRSGKIASWVSQQLTMRSRSPRQRKNRLSKSSLFGGLAPRMFLFSRFPLTVDTPSKRFWVSPTIKTQTEAGGKYYAFISPDASEPSRGRKIATPRCPLSDSSNQASQETACFGMGTQHEKGSGKIFPDHGEPQCATSRYPCLQQKNRVPDTSGCPQSQARDDSRHADLSGRSLSGCLQHPKENPVGLPALGIFLLHKKTSRILEVSKIYYPLQLSQLSTSRDIDRT